MTNLLAARTKPALTAVDQGRVPISPLVWILTNCVILAVVRPSLSRAAESTDDGGSIVAQRAISFNRDIRPILVKNCIRCHGGVKQLSGLSFVYCEQALAECDSGLTPIVPGRPADSYLLQRVSDPDPESRMPPADQGPPLSAGDIELLTRWIEQGARWEGYWSYVAPKPPQPPVVKHVDWPRDSLDRFILSKLEAAGLSPAAESDRATWLRRVSLDLIGLPPTSEEYDDFEHDVRPDAYQCVVDRLLASPQFGERWAAMWLDLARYADTKGYEKDEHRDAWPFRDWVIRAFNADMPYDAFTIKQLAGDLLPEGDFGDRVATAFQRNTQTNSEGGTDDEEFRIGAVIDRVATTWQVWQGVTFRCAQCHDHPYDAIRHKEYYKFLAFFNTSRDADVDEDYPVLATPTDLSVWPEAEALDRRILKLRQQLFDLVAPLSADASLWRPLRPDAAQATGQTKLVIQDADIPGVSEVLAEGTITANGTFTLEFPLDVNAGPITALRIDALPRNFAEAQKTPEMGFVLTRLRGELLTPEVSAPQEMQFVAAYCDEPQPILDPEDSLRDNNRGWGEYTRLSQPRFAVFVLGEPVPVTPGCKLRLRLEFNRTAAGRHRPVHPAREILPFQQRALHVDRQ